MAYANPKNTVVMDTATITSPVVIAPRIVGVVRGPARPEVRGNVDPAKFALWTAAVWERTMGEAAVPQIHARATRIVAQQEMRVLTEVVSRFFDFRGDGEIAVDATLQ
jgi:hypothetical protein